MIDVLVADDHPMMRSGLVRVLDACPDLRVVGDVGDGLDLLAHPALDDCDVVLLDLSMPRLDGLGALRVLAERGVRARVLVLTGLGDRDRFVEAIEAGAAGCVLKDAGPEELCDAVRSTARGGSVLAPEAAAAIVQSARRAAAPGPQLTPRELDVLRLVSQGVTNPAIAGRLGISHATVKTHLQRAFERLGALDRAHAVTLARDAGLL